MIYTIPHTVENAASLYPNKEAFRYDTFALTFSDLDTKSSQLAKHLSDSGIRKGDLVGIYMHRCLETAIAMYGILKSGAAYVPLDPTAPHARIQFLVDDCDIKFILATQKQGKKMNRLYDESSSLKQIIGVSEHNSIACFTWDYIFSISLEDYKKVKILEHDLAYIIYTSGSTGVPKGIMHSHYSGLSYARLSAELYGLNSEDRLANHAPLHFDVSTFAYFGGPLTGATTVIVSDAHTKMPASLAALISNEKISVWYSVPLALSQLVQSGVLENYDYSNLRFVLFAGEIFTIKYLKALMRIWPNTKYSNIYGPAETNQCTNYNFDSNTSIGDFLPIGKAWANTEYKILDHDDQEVSKGDTGELVVRSATMMIGYWNNAILTQKSFFKEKIAENLTHLFYRTGDLVKEDLNNDLLFLGRADRQVKIRGYRIELDEIEAILNQHQTVKEAAVCLLENFNEEKQIAAVVILKTNMQINTNELLAHCRSQLPTYAVPHSINILDDFPRTGSGKTDLTQIKEKIIAL